MIVRFQLQKKSLVMSFKGLVEDDLVGGMPP
jgi:hypothetical protein